MPVETTEKNVLVRVKNPDYFDNASFRTIDISEKEGIKATIGCKKGEFKDGKCSIGTEVQRYLFDKEKWDEEKATKWVEEKNETKEVLLEGLIRLNEVGKRNNATDEARLQEIKRLVMELLGEEEKTGGLIFQEKASNLLTQINEIEPLKGSQEEKRQKLQKALRKRERKDIFIEAILPDSIVYNIWDDAILNNPQYWQIEYQEKEGEIVFGKQEKVELKTVIVKKMEELKQKNGQGGYEKEERENLEKEREARSKKYKIGIKEGGNLTKPGEWADVADDDWADPVNYSYPIHTADNARNAKTRFANPDNREAKGYTEEEQQIIWERLIRAELKFGIEVGYDKDNPLDRVLPDEVKKKMKGFEKNETIQKKPHNLNEVLNLKVDILDETTDRKGEPVEVKAKIDVVQKADVLNENNRVYPKAVLEPEVKRLNELAKLGGVVMCATHPSNRNNNFSGQDVVAKINEISINENGIVSIPSLTFVGTQAGKDYIALAKAGVLLETSQRAMGSSTTKKLNGKPVEFVESLQISGWDLFPAGQVSVKDPDNRVVLVETKNNKEVIRMEITQDELNTQIQEAVSKATEGFKSQLNEVETLKSEREKERQINENKKSVEELLGKEETKWSRFNEAQQSIILKDLDYSGSIDEVKTRLNEKMTFVDTVIAQQKLSDKGFLTGKGTTHIEVTNNPLPGAERIKKLNEATRDILSMGEVTPRKPASHIQFYIDAVLQKFDREYGRELLNEADTMGAANLPTTYEYARVVIEQAFQNIVAFNLSDLGIMGASPEIIFLEKWSEKPTADLNSLKVGQGGTIAKAALALSPFTMYAETLKLAVALYEEALVAAISAQNYPLEARAIASLANDFRRRVDLYLFNLMIAKADTFFTGTVTTAETLAQVGTTKKWYSINGGCNYYQNPTNPTAIANRHNGWVKNEFIKVFNSTTNLASTSIQLVGTHSSSTLQKVEVIDSSAPSKTLVFGFKQSDGSVRVTEGDLSSALADYYVLYADGAIVIADSPVTAGLTAPYKAKYTYTKNTRVWTLTPPSGVTFEDHLKTLHQLTAEAKVLIGNRYYEPNFLALSLTANGMISNSKLYTNAGGNVANTLEAGGRPSRWAGLPISESPVIPDNKMIIGVKGAIVVRNLKPYYIKGPITSATTSENTYHALETTGIDCFLPDKLATVSIAE
ncbi:MAG: DUF6582 domain-containing protein [Bacillota bacterium]